MSFVSRLQSLFTPAAYGAQPQTLARSWDPDMSFLFNGNQYALTGLNQTLSTKIEDIDVGYESLVYRAYASNSVVFACMRVRRELFTEARFGFQDMRGGLPGDFTDGRDGRNPATGELSVLAHPWPGATTGDLLKYFITDNDLAGNGFVARRGSRLKRMRPDWTQIIHASTNPDANMWDLDAELIGYAYQPGGRTGGRPWVYLDASEVAHFSTTPDPLMPVRGMSWLTPIVREIMADEAMTEHRLKYFEHGGTPNLVIKTEYTDLLKLNEFMTSLRQNHEGVANAYKMMGFTAGVDAQVVGGDLKQIDFKVVQGGGETRIAAAAGVPDILAGLSEGLQGSSLNAGQGFAPSMRLFADLTMSPAWRNAAGSLEQIIRTPTGYRLWYDIRGIPALKDDIKSAAEVRALDATALRTLADGGWEPDSIVDAIMGQDWKRLKHTGLLSVQMQDPTAEPVPPPTTALVAGSNGNGNGKAPAELAPPKRSEDETLLLAIGRSHGLLVDLLSRGAAPVTIAEGAVQVTVNPGDTIVHSSPVTIAEGAVQVSAPVTIDEGAVTVTTPEVRIEAPITVEPANVTIAEGAFRSETTVEPPQLTIAEGAIRSETTVEAPAPVPSPEPVAMRTVIDRDPKTREVTGSHEEPV